MIKYPRENGNTEHGKGTPTHEAGKRYGDARAHRQSNFKTLNVLVNPGEGNTTKIELTATEFHFQFDSKYPNPGGEDNFQFRFNGAGWLQLLEPPHPPISFADAIIYSVEFWNKTAAAFRVRAIIEEQPYTTEPKG